MLNKLKNKIDHSLTTWQWWGLGILGFVVFNRTVVWLEGIYAQTQFPASVMAGQTTFDHEMVKRFYAFMSEQGTLDLYVKVQQLDFLLMVTMFAAIFGLTVAAYRSVKSISTLSSIAWWLVVITPLAPFFDALENAVSFVMLADIVNFHSSLAVIHSGLAVIKYALSFSGIFGAFIIGMLAIIIHTYQFISTKYNMRKVKT